MSPVCKVLDFVTVVVKEAFSDGVRERVMRAKVVPQVSGHQLPSHHSIYSQSPQIRKNDLAHVKHPFKFTFRCIAQHGSRP